MTGRSFKVLPFNILKVWRNLDILPEVCYFRFSNREVGRMEIELKKTVKTYPRFFAP